MDIDSLERIQRRMTKMISNDRGLQYHERLEKLLRKDTEENDKDYI